MSWSSYVLVGSIVLSLVSGAHAEPGDYLMAGNVRCLASTEVRPGRDLLFLVAVANDRLLVGWSFDIDGEIRENFRYICQDDNIIGFNFASNLGQTMLESKRYDLDYVALQSQRTDGTNASRFGAIQMSRFRDYPFAIFLSCSYLGVSRADVLQLGLNDGEETTETPFGKLTVEHNGGLQKIRFLQQSTDLLTARENDLRLADATWERFPTGIAQIRYLCKFDPPLATQPQAPWTAHCLIEEKGQNGHLYRAQYRVQVDVFSTDATWIDQEIDRVVGAIPEGEEVQSNDPIDYVWKDEIVVRRIDNVALAKAGQLSFRRFAGRNSVLLIGLLAVVVGGGYWARNWRATS